jgi:hypothetical protein
LKLRWKLSVKVLHLSIAQCDDGDKEESFPGSLFTVVNNLEICFAHSEIMVPAVHFCSEINGERGVKRYRNACINGQIFAYFPEGNF